MLRISVSQKVVAEFSCNSSGLCSRRHSQYKVILKCSSENIFFLVAGTNSTDFFFFFFHLAASLSRKVPALMPEMSCIGNACRICYLGFVSVFFAIVIMVFTDFLMPKGAIYGLK